MARTHLIRAAASACTRVQRVFDDDIMDAADPIAASMADLGPAPSRPSKSASQFEATAIPVTTPAADSLFQVYDARPFSTVIGDVIEEPKAEGV